MGLTLSSVRAVLIATLWTVGCAPAQIRGGDPEDGERTPSSSLMKLCMKEGIVLTVPQPQRPDAPDLICYNPERSHINYTCKGDSFYLSHYGDQATPGNFYFQNHGPKGGVDMKQKPWMTISGVVRYDWYLYDVPDQNVVVTDFSLPWCGTNTPGPESVPGSSAADSGSAPDGGSPPEPSPSSPAELQPPSGGGECGSITETGCCDGDTLKYCNNTGVLKALSCGSCGWNPGKSWYDCKYTGSAPSNTPPRSCSAL